MPSVALILSIAAALAGAAEIPRVALSADGQILVRRDESGVITVTQTADERLRYEWRGTPGDRSAGADGLAVSNDGGTVARLDRAGGRLTVVDLRAQVERPIAIPAESFALSDDGRYLAVKSHLGVTLVRTGDGATKPLFDGGGPQPPLAGAMAFFSGTVRKFSETPDAGEKERRLRYFSIHRATEFRAGEEVDFTELPRRTLGSFPIHYPARAVESSRDGRMVMTLAHSIVDVWDIRRPHSPLTFAVPGNPSRFTPIETATLNAAGTRLAVVYPHGIMVMRATDGEEIARIPFSQPGTSRTFSGAVAARFLPGAERLVVARAQGGLTIFPLPPSECDESIAGL